MVAYTYTHFTRYSKRLKKDIYYARFRDPDTGDRMSGISSGKTTWNEFRLWCDDYLKQGRFSEKSKQKFRDFAEGWFIWDSCPWNSPEIVDT